MTKVYVKEEDFEDAVSLAEAIIDLHAAGYEVFLEGRSVGLFPTYPQQPTKPIYPTTPTIPGWPPTIISNATVAPEPNISHSSLRNTNDGYWRNPNTGFAELPG